MDKEDIINYVMETPGNSNPAILGSMLDQYGGGGGSSGGGLIVNVAEDTSVYTMDKTAMEIVAALKAGSPVHAIFPDDGYYKDDIASIVSVRGEVEDGEVYRYNVYVCWRGQTEQFFASEGNNWYPQVNFD